MAAKAMEELVGEIMREMTVGRAMEEWMVLGSREWTADEIPERPRRWP